MRISDHLLVQRVDDLIVVFDESTAAGVTFPVAQAPRVAAALRVLVEPR